MKKIGLASLILLTNVLTGCTAMNNQFECPMKPGVMCKSLDEVNQLVDENTPEVVLNESQIKSVESKLTIYPVKVGGLASIREFETEQVLIMEEPPQFIPDSLKIARHPERTLRVWLAPYEDTEGIYHEAHHLWMVIAPGFWIPQTI